MYKAVPQQAGMEGVHTTLAAKVCAFLSTLLTVRTSMLDECALEVCSSSMPRFKNVFSTISVQGNYGMVRVRERCAYGKYVVKIQR